MSATRRRWLTPIPRINRPSVAADAGSACRASANGCWGEATTTLEPSSIPAVAAPATASVLSASQPATSAHGGGCGKQTPEKPASAAHLILDTTHFRPVGAIGFGTIVKVTFTTTPPRIEFGDCLRSLYGDSLRLSTGGWVT